jgi:hypothetical protein
MRLIKARVQKYRSIQDSGWFDVEVGRTILVGPDEARRGVGTMTKQVLVPNLDRRRKVRRRLIDLWRQRLLS